MILDKVYIITLNHSQENYNSILERLSKLELPYGTPYTIFEGVNGRELFSTQQGRLDYGIKFYDGWELNDLNKFWNRNVTVGEVGCSMSHIKVWEDAYANKYNHILVLEDDFESNEPIDWECFSELTKYDYDIAYLGRILQKAHDNVYDSAIGMDSWVNPGYSYQTHSYTITKSGIVKLIETNVPTFKNNIITIDEFLPSTYSVHPRKDIRDMFIQNMNAVAHIGNPITQFRNETNGGSMTAPIKGIDYD
jgi:hypothetical protein